MPSGHGHPSEMVKGGIAQRIVKEFNDLPVRVKIICNRVKWMERKDSSVNMEIVSRNRFSAIDIGTSLK